MDDYFEINSPGIDCFRFSSQPTLRQQHLLLKGTSPISVSGHWGEMLFQHLKNPGYWIWYSHYETFEKREFSSRINRPVLEFSMQFFNGAQYFVYPFKHQTVKQTEFNLVYFPYVESRVPFLKGQRCSTLDIHLDLDYLKVIGASFPKLLGPFIERVTNDKAVQFFDAPICATAFMVELAQNIFRGLHCNIINNFILDLNVKMLLSYGVVCKEEKDLKKRKVTLEEISRVHELAYAVLQDLSQVPGVGQMARMVGMNETTFNRIFKEVHQASPQAFFNKKRLLTALDKIAGTGGSITDIALEAGFANVHSFSKAFRKQFNASPRAYRNK